MMDGKKNNQGGVGVKEISDTRNKRRRPPKYKVVIFNDEEVMADVVVEVLKHVFNKSEAEATAIMSLAHEMNTAVVEITTKDMADTHADEGIKLSLKLAKALFVFTGGQIPVKALRIEVHEANDDKND